MRVVLAIFISILIHLALGVALAVALDQPNGPEVAVTIDLSSVELSVAEKDVETAPVAPSLPSAESAPAPRPRPEEMAEPEEKPTDRPRAAAEAPAPVPADLSPPEEAPLMETPPPPPVPAKTPSAASAPAPAVAPVQARVDAPPRPRRTIRPVYPIGSRQRGEEGVVTLEIGVDEKGVCSSATVATGSGFAELDEAAVKAVRSARFVPAVAAGKPVASTARLTLRFKLK